MVTAASAQPLPAQRFTWRLVEGLVADRVLVTWVDHLLGYATELRISRPNGELTLLRTAGAELPPHAFCQIIEEVAAMLRLGPVSPAVAQRWVTLCAFEPELAELTREWPTIKLRGAQEYIARVSVGDARVYVRMLLSAGEWRKAVSK